MPKWWPWGRSTRAAPDPVATAARPEPTWHRLPVIQRTVGDIEPTARLEDFNASLTTAQNPALTGQLEVLSAAHPERLPVLDAVRDSVGAPAHQPHGACAMTQQPRTWSPKLPTAQRVHLGSAPAVQRVADVADSPRELHPIEASSPAEPQPDSLIAAPQPLGQRILEVATDDSSSDGAWSQEPSPASPTAGESAAVPNTSDMDSASTTAAEAPVPSLAKPLSTVPPDSNVVTADSPPRHLPSVQRAVTGNDRPPEHVSNAAPLPVVRAADSSGSQRRDHQADTGTTPARGSEPTLQRAPAVGPDRGVETATTSLRSAPTSPSHASDELPLLPTIGTGPPATTKQPVTAQRVTPSMAKPDAAPPRADSAVPPGVSPDAPPAAVQRLPVDGVRRLPVDGVQRLPVVGLQRLPVVGVQRLPVVDAHPGATGAGAGRQFDGPEPPAVQRYPAGVQSPRVAPRSVDTGTAPHPRAGDAADVAASPAASAATTSVPAFGGTSEAGSPSTAAVVQRFAPPAVRPAAAAQHESPTAPGHSDPPVTPVVQRVPSGGRLVVLPPVRSSTTSDSPGDTPHGLARTVISENPRPMSLQRMFEHTARFADDAPGSAAPSTGIAGPSYESATNTITFPPVSVQREPESAPSPTESAPSPAPAPTVTATAGPSPTLQPAGDVEELVNRLYDPLAARLRAELWLDRERAGVLMDLGR